MLAHAHRELQDSQYAIFVDGCRQFVDCTSGVLESLGYDRAEFLKKTIDNLSFRLEELPGLFQQFLEEGRLVSDYVLRHRNGAPVPIRFRSFLFSDGCKGARWDVITDWRLPYLSLKAEPDPGNLGRHMDAASAAIHRTLCSRCAARPGAQSPGPAIFEALAEIDTLKDRVDSVLTPKLMSFEKTRGCLLQLADHLQDKEAAAILFEENRLLFRTSIERWLPNVGGDLAVTELLNRVAHMARYYDPEENPVVWLHRCMELECRRLQGELANSQEHGEE